MKRREGFTLVEIMIVVLAIGILTAIALPSFNAARSRTLAKAKQSNVRTLNNAVQEWAMDLFLSDNAPITDEVGAYIKGGLGALSVGKISVKVESITSKTVGHTFTVADIY